MKKLNYIDLFAGAGGLSEGFVRAGFTPIAHVEMNKDACDTLKTRTAYHWLKENGKPICIQTQKGKELFLYLSVKSVEAFKLSFVSRLVRNSKFFSSFSTTCFQHFAAVSGRHSFSEPVFVLSFPVRWLKCSFHFYSFLLSFFYFSDCKNSSFFLSCKRCCNFLRYFEIISITMILKGLLFAEYHFQCNQQHQPAKKFPKQFF